MVLDRRRAFRCVLSFNYIPQSRTRVTQFCVLQLLSTCCYSFTAAAVWERETRTTMSSAGRYVPGRIVQSILTFCGDKNV